ncbi:hypothetical protein L195_g007063 [Trifolium pratense]|uniref:Uncharacterized protein n=1 Tax=Trifolium pratense TaxID=57577 RepID=A0A2K3P5C4_TRIPR|nr:hypothetical protein L195_g007063 [Trifolium pratense]
MAREGGVKSREGVKVRIWWRERMIMENEGYGRVGSRSYEKSSSTDDVLRLLNHNSCRHSHA